MEGRSAGTRILFKSHPGEDPRGYGSNLYAIHPDGTDLRQLTHFPSHDRTSMGSFSPDGKSIVFGTSAGAIGGDKEDIFVMNADGTGMRLITRTTNLEAGADWGPAP